MSIKNSKIFLRIKSSIPWALQHLALSLMIVCALGMLVFFVWFPWPFLEISGGWSLLWLIFAVDVVCGPALTMLLLHPGKQRNALLVDIALILTIQASALIYGIYSLSQARPVAVVFEVDRFRAVSYADIDTSRSEAMPAWVNILSFSPPRVLGVRGAKDVQEKIESVDASLQGVEPAQRPHWWQEYELSLPQVKARAKPVDRLLALNPGLQSSIQDSALHAAEKPQANEVSRASELLWIPVVSARSMNWVAFIDPNSGRIRGYVRADGFGV